MHVYKMHIEMFYKDPYNLILEWHEGTKELR